MFDVDAEVTQAMLDNTKRALSSSLQQVESLIGMLEPHVDAEVLEKLKESFTNKIKQDLAGG
jgi:hypothetical protein